MEIQTPMLHHNPYEIKSEQPSTPPKSLIKSPYLDSNDMFGNFQLHPTLYAPLGNSDPLNNNNLPKLNSNGRALAADRKRPYPCNLCPSKFGSKMELEEHQNSHTGQKPFECDVCKARFNRRSTLWNHKRIHSDAKPFVCTVCQMTFKWKNSLKCHKDMHQRKNETSSHLDNDLRQLTYATAAKKKLMMEQEENGISPSTLSAISIHAHPLITTTSAPKKKKVFKVKSTSNQQTSLPNVHLNNVQPLQASSLIPPSDHQLDLDTSSLDTLMHNQSQNILMQLYGEVDSSRQSNNMLSGIDESTIMSNLSDSKSDSTNSSVAQLNMQLPMQINMLNFRQLNSQQLFQPSVHHLTSTSLASVSSNMDYGVQHESVSNVPHSQYIVTSQPDMMLSQQQINYQQPLDNCALQAAGLDYVSNFDYSMLNQQYQMNTSEQQDHHQTVNHNREVKVLPYDQW